MNKIKSALLIFTILSILPFSACVKGGAANTNPTKPPLYKTLSNGAIVSLKSLRASFAALGKTSDVAALDKIIAIADPINTSIQNADGTNLKTQIEDFARLGAQIAGTLGLSPDIVIAINLGIGVFQSIEPLFFGSASTSSGDVVAASDVQADPRVRLGQLQGLDAKYKRTAGRQ